MMRPAILIAALAVAAAGCGTHVAAQPHHQAAAKPTASHAPASHRPAATHAAPPVDVRYDAYSATMSAAGYPVFPKVKVDGYAKSFCAAGQADIEAALLAAVTDDPSGAEQLGAEIGSIVGAYCPGRTHVYRAALDDLTGGQ